MSSRRERGRDRDRPEEEDDDPSRYPKYMSITGESLDLDLDKGFLGKCRHIDEFESLNHLGEGTYGVVRRARDRKTTSRSDKHAIVALKQVRIFDEDRNNGIPITALREIFLLRDLKHRNVVRVLDVAVGDELHDVYMVMEYAEQVGT
ncbi:Cdc2- kinase [Arthrobotrys conoides]|uniref:cyclin-dependent kinase n=1 Tax=Arthrobotrys conoides TaxID=74498 RepID=A0AAN8NF16_9PEZI